MLTADVAEASACSDAYAATSFQVTLICRDAGRAMMLLRTDASVKATVLDAEAEGQAQGEGVETVPPLSSQATH